MRQQLLEQNATPHKFLTLPLRQIISALTEISFKMAHNKLEALAHHGALAHFHISLNPYAVLFKAALFFKNCQC